MLLKLCSCRFFSTVVILQHCSSDFRHWKLHFFIILSSAHFWCINHAKKMLQKFYKFTRYYPGRYIFTDLLSYIILNGSLLSTALPHPLNYTKTILSVFQSITIIQTFIWQETNVVGWLQRIKGVCVILTMATRFGFPVSCKMLTWTSLDIRSWKDILPSSCNRQTLYSKRCCN